MEAVQDFFGRRKSRLRGAAKNSGRSLFNVFRKLRAQKKGQNCEELLGRLDVLLARGDCQSAKAVAEAAERQFPDDAFLCIRIARLALAAGDQLRALEYSKRAALAAPDDGPLISTHSEILRRSGKPLEALSSIADYFLRTGNMLAGHFKAAADELMALPVSPEESDRVRDLVRRVEQKLAAAGGEPPVMAAVGDLLARIGESDAARAAPDPEYGVDSILISPAGRLFVAGWIDDSAKRAAAFHVSSANWRVSFAADEVLRFCREDIYQALGRSRDHPYGFWAFAVLPPGGWAGGACTVELELGGGKTLAVSRPPEMVEDGRLRDTALSHLGRPEFLSSRIAAALAALDHRMGSDLVDFSSALCRALTVRPHIERVGPQRQGSPKGSIVVCLYNKPEFFFLQNAAFHGNRGIEEFEFIYVSNSPELGEFLLREARIASSIYGHASTLVLLPGNAGFAAANNLAAQHARSGRMLFVNPDVFPTEPSWAEHHSSLIDTLPRQATAMFGAPLFYDDGSLMHGGMYFDADPIVCLGEEGSQRTTAYRIEHYGKGAPPRTEQFLRARPVPAVTGAFMSCDRTWFEKLGGFTEQYVFGGYEDADLCLKSLDRGIAPWLHDLRFWHLEGKASIRLPVHDGASILNRWLFGRLWGAKLEENLLGQAPAHPLLAGSTAASETRPSGRRGTVGGRGRWPAVLD